MWHRFALIVASAVSFQAPALSRGLRRHEPRQFAAQAGGIHFGLV
jgi:hypothetical protein